MPIRLNIALFVCLSQVAPTWGQQEPDYWPLAVGNTWVYELTWRQDTLIFGNGVEIYQDPKELVWRNAETGDSVAVALVDSFFFFSGQVDIGTITLMDRTELKVLSKEERDNRIYFRLSNGQLIRKDEHGNIVEYNDRFSSFEAKEHIIFDFRSLEEENYSYNILYRPLPPMPGFEGPPFGPVYRIMSSGRTTALGSFAETVEFRYRFDPDSSIDVVFADGIGPIVTSSLTKHEMIHYELQNEGAPTPVEAYGWGAIKNNISQ